MFTYKKTQYLKVLIFSKFICRFNIIPIKIPGNISVKLINLFENSYGSAKDLE